MSDSSIDRAALERILRRAAELQTSEREIGEGLTPDDVLALGREVGIPGQYLQQAMIEERAHVEPTAPTGLADRLAGPPSVSAQRVVAGTQEEVTQALLAYMEEHELLCVQRQQPGRITWEPLGGFQATVRPLDRRVRFGKKLVHAVERADGGGDADAARGGIHPRDTGRRCPRAAPELSRRRHRGAVGGHGGGGGPRRAHALPRGRAAAPLPFALGVGYGVMRQYHPKLARIQLGLERTLDHLQQNDVRPRQLPPVRPGLVNLLADEVRKALKS